MSAYVNNREERVTPLHPASATSGVTKALEDRPASRVISEIEELFSRGKELEAAIAEERAHSQKTNDSNRELSLALKNLQSEYTQLKEAFLKNQNHFKASFIRFNQLKSAYLFEKARREQLETLLEKHQQDAGILARNREELETLKNEVFQLHRSERNLKIEINSYLDQIKILSEERRKLEIERKSEQLENDLQKSMMEQHREQESSLKRSLESVTHQKDLAQAESARLLGENTSLKAKLEELKAAVSVFRAREEKFNHVLAHLQKKDIESSQIRNQFEEEKASKIRIEELLRKERNEKAIALRVLKEAESKLNGVSQELENLKARPQFEKHPEQSDDMIHLEI